MTINKKNKPHTYQQTTKYLLASVLASVIILAFTTAPAYAAIQNHPPYTNCFKFTGGSPNDRSACNTAAGNDYVYAQPGGGYDGQTYARVVKALPVTLYAGNVVTLSDISANVKGSLYVVPTTGIKANIKVMAYLSKLSDGGTAVQNKFATLLSKEITTGSWSTNQLYTATSVTYTIPTTGTYYVVAYAENYAKGSLSNSHFHNFDGSGNGITNFKIKATY